MKVDAAGPLATNRRAWDLRTSVHARSAFYDVDAFRRGANTLQPPELALVGDPHGLRLLHLQCHIGLDTLSWARLGAVVTGVDFSPASIAYARRLSRETGLAAAFLEHDVQTLDDRFDRGFDVVVATYGVLCWLQDLDGWARGIRGSLRQGGRAVLVDFHPVLEVLYPGSISGTSTYFGSSDARRETTWGTYAESDHPIEYDEYRWQHSLAETAGALQQHQLRVSGLHEYAFAPYPIAPGLVRGADGRWSDPAAPGRVPYLFGLVVEG